MTPRSEDPIDLVSRKARNVIHRAAEAGIKGPPFDPFEIASFLGITLVPTAEISDAKIERKKDKYWIYYNPTRPKARINFSVAHEIAHTFFTLPEGATKYRLENREISPKERLLESLCNVGASELLMPSFHIASVLDELPTVKLLLQLRQEYQVSIEAAALRLAKISNQQFMIVALSTKGQRNDDLFTVDYCMASTTWARFTFPRNTSVRLEALSDCVAIGFTAHGKLKLPDGTRATVEGIGVSPFPHTSHPRIIALLRPESESSSVNKALEYVYGDATIPGKKGLTIIAFVVNDKTANWGAGFGLAMKRKFPHCSAELQKRFSFDKGLLKLGNCIQLAANDSVSLACLVAQHGYGSSPHPRVRYDALESALAKLALDAKKSEAVVQMPRIGCGEAGGRWELVEELIHSTLLANGVRVKVYDLPPRS